MSEERSWWRRRERGSAWGVRVTAWLYRRIGASVARALLHPIVAYFFLTDRSGRSVSVEYLRRVHDCSGGTSLIGASPSLRHVYRHFHEFAASILDRVGFWLGRHGDFDLELHGSEHLERVAREGRGALVLGSHLGSFDAMRLIADLKSPIDVSVLMYKENAARINELFDRLGDERSLTPRVRVIQVVPGSFAHALEAKRRIARGEVVAILADRIHPNEPSRVSWVSFLGEEAAFPQGPMLLASVLGCPVLFMVALRTGRGRYEIRVELLAKRVEVPRRDREAALTRYCQDFADRLARHCMRAPYQWFNFYDFWARDDSRLDG